MNVKNVIYTGVTKQDESVLIRYPVASDLVALWEYINNLSQERTFIRYQGETITLDDEQKFLDNQLDKIAQKKGIMLLAFIQGTLVGAGGIEMESLTEAHVGELGLSVTRSYRENGIGKI